MKRRIEKRKDPKYMGVPNINFSLVSQNEEREGKFMNQRKTRGFDDSELWSFDCTICSFISPRLKVFIENCDGFPAQLNSEEEWKGILHKMLYAFEHYDVGDYDDKIIEGLDLFRKYFTYLWD